CRTRLRTTAIRNVTTVVIGAGHAGLATSRCLCDRSIDHVVLERGEIAHAWRTERWDSLRKSGSRVRITAQLIDAETDRHLWAERYDRELADIFAIQDEVTSSIVSILPGRVAAAPQTRVQRKPPENLVAYECVLAGKLFHHRSTRADNEEALRMLERAIALDPGYAHAHAWKACVLGQSTVTGWCADVKTTRLALIRELTKALSLDENDSDVHRVL